MEDQIREKKRDVQNFKIFHIWKIIGLNNKLRFLPWSANFQPVTKEIELEIHSYENKTSQSKVVGFTLNTEECDKCLSATIGDCKVMYSLFSNAVRGRLEIRPYNADGSPACNISGHVRAYFDVGRGYGKFLFGVANKCEMSEHTAASNTLMLCPFTFIFPRDICLFRFDISLKDNARKFAVKENTVIRRRTLALDEQHYIVGKKSYIILTIVWACLCMDLQQGVCTCAGTAILDDENNDIGEGISDESNNVDSSEDTEDEPDNEACGEDTEDKSDNEGIKDESDIEDSVQGRMKRAKIRHNSSASQEEDSDNSEDIEDESKNEDSAEGKPPVLPKRKMTVVKVP